MKIKIGKFHSNNYNKNNAIALVYENENAKVYSIKLLFKYYIILTLNN